MIQSPPEQWTKLEKIRYLLDQWDTIHDPDVCSPFGSPGDGTGVQLMPLMSRHPSVLELGRTLGLLLWANPGDYRHLIAYRQCEWRVVWVNTRIRGPRGKMINGDPKPERRRVLPSWIDVRVDKDGVPIAGRVAQAESFLADKFRGEVFIPAELWDALNTPAVAA